MGKVFYLRTSPAAVQIKPTSETLKYGGKPWPGVGAWSLGADAFETLRAENPQVVFIEESK
jgi:hypothetical protein